MIEKIKIISMVNQKLAPASLKHIVVKSAWSMHLKAQTTEKRSPMRSTSMKHMVLPCIQSRLSAFRRWKTMFYLIF